jgi:phage tail sheath protein FI
MTDVRYPGVYIEEISLGPHSIDGVPTSTVGFVGEAVSGALGEAVKVTSLVDFDREFGGLDA